MTIFVWTRTGTDIHIGWQGAAGTTCGRAAYAPASALDVIDGRICERCRRYAKRVIEAELA